MVKAMELVKPRAPASSAADRIPGTALRPTDKMLVLGGPFKRPFLLTSIVARSAVKPLVHSRFQSQLFSNQLGAAEQMLFASLSFSSFLLNGEPQPPPPALSSDLCSLPF